MADPSEIATLKASFRGTLTTADALRALQRVIEGLDPQTDITAAELDELARVTAAHSIASAALRGLVVTMLTRRGTRTV